MKYFLGIDGGGTKTAMQVRDENGNTFPVRTGRGCSYKTYGVPGVVTFLYEEAQACIQACHIKKDDVAGIALGLPCYGEDPLLDPTIEALVREQFFPVPVYITNDVEVGWAGSLAMGCGIHLVAGTGSIGYGQDASGKSARAGGWSEIFSDEGSCRWLGIRTMGLFGQQADGRVAKGPLYYLLREKFELKNDMDFVGIMEKDYLPYRDKIASMQRYLLEAARAGDESAKDLYRQAAGELYKIIAGVRAQLDFGSRPVPVSYSGGLFYAEEFVLPVLEKCLEGSGMVLEKPLLSPVEGAALLAAAKFGG